MILGKESKEVRSARHSIVRRRSRRKKEVMPARRPLGLRIIRADRDQSCYPPVGLETGVRDIGPTLRPTQVPTFPIRGTSLNITGGPQRKTFFVRFWNSRK